MTDSTEPWEADPDEWKASTESQSWEEEGEEWKDSDEPSASELLTLSADLLASTIGLLQMWQTEPWFCYPEYWLFMRSTDPS